MKTETEVPLLDKLEDAVFSIEEGCEHPWSHKLSVGQMCQLWCVTNCHDIVLKTDYQKQIKDLIEEWGGYDLRIRLNTEWETEEFSAVCSIVGKNGKGGKRPHVVLFRTKGISAMWVKLFETPGLYSKYGYNLHSKDQKMVWDALFEEPVMTPSGVKKFIWQKYCMAVTEHFEEHPYLLRDLARYHNTAVEAADPKYIGTRHGTHHFVSAGYTEYRGDDLQNALEEGRIAIGKPEVPPGHRLLENNGRYWLEQIAIRGKTLEQTLKIVNPVLSNIALMTVNGTRLELPKSTKFDNYTQVKDALLKAGGKYKNNGFEFGKCAQEIYDRLLGGEKLNDKKKFQFFATPEHIVQKVQELAGVEETHTVLEPSAGHGALVEGIDKSQVQCFELFEDNVAVLNEKGYQVAQADFLSIPAQEIYDRILANPPFTKNQDIDHIRHMYDFLAPGGKLVSIASKSWKMGSQKKQKEFNDWLVELNAHVTYLGSGEFKSSGTNIETCIITIEKK